uniref:BED-type domain-containing protein n=1 Tax=Chenopodium quinoa TaxID=63459 RepID=A0A803MGQ2_CHEQI
MYGLTELSNIRQLEFGLTECMESGSSGDMEDSSATSQAPPIPSPPPEPWEKRRSPHWEHFIKNDGENKDECIYCHTFIGCASLQGTSGMKNHIKRCKEYPPNIDQNQQLLSLSQQTLDGNLVDQKKGRLELWKFNQEDSRRALAKMVIMDEMSFRMVEHEGGVPEPSDWDRVASFLPLLKIFYDATLRVSGSLYITSNVYLQEIVGISVLIKKKMLSNDAGVSLMASGMKKKHDKYWENVDNVNLLLYIAVILDPRRKMGYTKWAINQQYDSEKAKYLCDKVMQTLNDMYELYISENPPNESILPKTSDFSEEVEDMDSDVDVAELEFERQMGSCVGVQGKNELAKYLEDDREVNPAGKSFDCGSLDKNIIKQVGTRKSSGSQVGEVRRQQPQGQGQVGCQSGRQR